jgi:hypothetical protein
MLVSLVFVLLPSSSPAASMCNADKAASEALGVATARASAKFLEAASQALLVFKAIEEASDASSAHAEKVRALLDDAVGAYQAALKLSADLAQADKFLKARPFEKLQITLGITPGTLNHKRWELLAKTVRESKTPAADLIGVCVAGAESLKYVTSTVKPGMQPAQLRRAAYNWHLVLMHGSLVSDAFDSSVR